MRTIVSSILSLCLTLATPFTAAREKHIAASNASKSTLQVAPDSLGAIVLGQKIKLMTRDGTYAEGKVFRASQTEITMEVRKSEPKGRLPRPEAIIPTSDIGTIYLVKNGTIAAPVALGVAAGFAGAIAAAYSAENVHSQAGFISIMLLGAAGGATGGAVLGREMAKKMLQINITEPSPRRADSRSGN